MSNARNLARLLPNASGQLPTGNIQNDAVTVSKLAAGAVSPIKTIDSFELCYGRCDGSRPLRQLAKVACGGPNSDDNHSIYWQWDQGIIFNTTNNSWVVASGNAHVVFPSGSAFIVARTAGQPAITKMG